MARLSPRARRQTNRLIDYYLTKQRLEAATRLRKTVIAALSIVENPALTTKPFPSTYRSIASLGYRWFKLHRYWFAIESKNGEWVIAHVVYDQANIPSRIK